MVFTVFMTSVVSLVLRDLHPSIYVMIVFALDLPFFVCHLTLCYKGVVAMAQAAEEVEYAVEIGAVDPEKSSSLRSASRFATWMAYATAAAGTSTLPAWLFYTGRLSCLLLGGWDEPVMHHTGMVLQEIDHVINLLTLLTQSGFIGPRLPQHSALTRMRRNIEKMLALDAEEEKLAKRTRESIKEKMSVQMDAFESLRYRSHVFR